jgi:hypothetical protein
VTDQEADQAKRRSAAQVDAVHASVEMVRAAPRHLDVIVPDPGAKWDREFAEMKEVCIRHWGILQSRYGVELALDSLISSLAQVGGYCADQAENGQKTTREAMLNKLAFSMVLQAPVMQDKAE